MKYAYLAILFAMLVGNVFFAFQGYVFNAFVAGIMLFAVIAETRRVRNG